MRPSTSTTGESPHPKATPEPSPSTSSPPTRAPRGSKARAGSSTSAATCDPSSLPDGDRRSGLVRSQGGCRLGLRGGACGQHGNEVDERDECRDDQEHGGAGK